MWTIDELVEQVRAALAAEYPGAPNGRVRDLPDRRAIRWYTTTGLIDRPTMRGRTALYGPRQLLQLVALKRRQAAGRTLAQIQAELTGATDRTLLDVARIPPGHVVLAEDYGHGTPATRARFWADVPGGPAEAALATVAAAGAPTGTTARPDGVPSGATYLPTSDQAPAGPAVGSAATAPGSDPPAVLPLTGVALDGGVVLLLPGRPTASDYAAIADAARPLLDVLAARRLLRPDETHDPEDPAPHASHTPRSAS